MGLNNPTVTNGSQTLVVYDSQQWAFIRDGDILRIFPPERLDQFISPGVMQENCPPAPP